MPLAYWETPLFVLAILLAVFIPLERLRPAYKGWPSLRPQFATDLLYFLCAWLIILCEIRLLASGLIDDVFTPYRIPALQDGLRALPLAVQAPLAIFLMSFFDYWAHRLLHTRAFWPIHVVHHSSPKVDWLAATRVHPLEMLWLRFAQILPMCWLGFSVEAYTVKIIAWFVYGDFTHANLRLPWGWLKYVLVTPEAHHWHHSKVREREGDTNFGGFILLWDWLFGTWHKPDGAQPAVLGVENTLPPGFLAQLIHPFRPKSR